jgi:hypothetical protein
MFHMFPPLKREKAYFPQGGNICLKVGLLQIYSRHLTLVYC